MKLSNLFFGIFFMSFIGHAQDKVQRIDSLFTALHSSGAFNGNVLIADKGNILFEKSYGLANEQTKQPLDTETMFELASVSKQFTAAAIVLLQKQGKLQYDDKLSKYIPELAFYEGITIRHLLNHTGGLLDYMAVFEKDWDKTKIATNADIIKVFAQNKPAAIFTPNSKFEYSNTGYALLASVIERVSGKSFEEYLTKNIFKPLKMTRTTVYQSRFKPRKIDNYARGYVMDANGKKALPDDVESERMAYFLDGIVGDGTVNSTLHDLLKWDRALYTDAIYTQADRDLVFATPMTTDGKPTNYSFGWILNDSPKYGKMVYHSGGWAGYITYIERQIDTDRTIIFLQNNMTATSKNPASDVRKILNNESLATVKLTKITPLATDLAKYAGTYSSPSFPLKIMIKPEGTVLTAQATGQGAFPMDAYANHTFMFDMANIKMVFRPEENKLLFSQGLNEIVFTKE